MRRIIVATLFSLISFASSGQWNTISGNPTQFVTRANLLDAVNHGVFYTGGTTIPNDNNFFVKSSTTSYVNINTSNSYYTAKGSTDFISVQDLTATWASSGNLYSFDGNVGWATATDACNGSHISAAATVQWNGGAIGNSIILYSGTTALNKSSSDYFWMGGYAFNFSTQYTPIVGGNYTYYSKVANYTACGGGLTDVYLHVSSSSGTTTPSCVVTCYSDITNTTPINIANASGGYLTVQVTFEDNFGDTQTSTGLIYNGSNTVSITGAAFPAGGTLVNAYVSGYIGSSSTQYYIPH